MSNFHPKLQDSTNEQLMHMVNELDFRVVPLASDELTRRSINELNESIKKMDKSSSRYSQTMMNLTFVMLFVALIQILIPLIVPNDAKLYIRFGIFIILIIALAVFVKKYLKNNL